MEAKEIERADENGAKEDVRVDVKMDEEWVHSADEDLYKEDTQELKQFISGTTSRLGDCAKITMLGWYSTRPQTHPYHSDLRCPCKSSDREKK
eukprot:1354721-Amorphochlora_amoeboformis.AAC.3